MSPFLNRMVLLWLCLSAGAMAACSSSTVGYDYDSRANFRAYRTYEWLVDKQENTGDKRVDNVLVDARIRTAIGTELRAKGYVESPDSKPDFFVAYYMRVKDLMKGSSTQNYIGDRATGTFTTLSDIHAYKEGTLLIDVVDGSSKQLVWRGSALAEVDPGMTPEDRDKLIRRVVQAMFAHFPPK